MMESNNDTHIIKSFKRICKQQIAIDCNNMDPDLRMSQIKMLSAFNGSSSLSLQELADNSGVTVPRMAAMVKRLIKDGIIARCKDDKDRRRSAVSLTPQGEKLRNQIAANRRKAAKALYAHLNNKDRVILLNSLDTACKILEKITRR
jgi:DNA-binding MarR family transcriptional regulator